MGTYHTNRVFHPVTFTIPGVPTAFEVCTMAGKLTSVVGPTNVITNSYSAKEYQSAKAVGSALRIKNKNLFVEDLMNKSLISIIRADPTQSGKAKSWLIAVRSTID